MAAEERLNSAKEAADLYINPAKNRDLVNTITHKNKTLKLYKTGHYKLLHNPNSANTLV